MNRILPVAIAAVLMCASGCANAPSSPYAQFVDDNTGESLTYAASPTRFLAEKPALSRVGKDYLYAAPVRVSRFDGPQTFLWLAVGSSVDRRITGAAIPKVATIVILVDDMPMTFDLVDWSDITASEPFELGVEHYTSYGARVTNSQLRRIAAAGTLHAYVISDNHRSPLFVVADGADVAWPEF